MLDRIPAAWRDALFAVVAAVLYAVLVWVQQTYTTWQLPDVLNVAIAAALPLLVGFATTLTRKYGAGSAQVTSVPPDPNARAGA